MTMSKSTDAEVVEWLDSNCKRGWGMCLRSDGWGATTTDDRGPIACNVTGRGDTQSEARAMLAQALGMGAPAAAPRCPLPEVGGWEWCCLDSGEDSAIDSFEYQTAESASGDWLAVYGPSNTRRFWMWDSILKSLGDWAHRSPKGVAKTRRGAMRAAERAARRAWEVRNGGGNRTSSKG